MQNVARFCWYTLLLVKLLCTQCTTLLCEEQHESAKRTATQSTSYVQDTQPVGASLHTVHRAGKRRRSCLLGLLVTLALLRNALPM